MAYQWGERETRILKELLEQGLSAQEIANELNKRFDGMDVSRNAIIGRCHRIKAKFKNPTGKQTVKKERPRKVIKVIAAPPIEVIELPVFLEKKKTNISLEELNGNTCRWPSGDHPPYLYCGQSIQDGTPYCEDHCKLAYTKSIWQGERKWR